MKDSDRASWCLSLHFVKLLNARWLNISQKFFRSGNSYRVWYVCQVVSVGVMRSGGMGGSKISHETGLRQKSLFCKGQRMPTMRVLTWLWKVYSQAVSFNAANEEKLKTQNQSQNSSLIFSSFLPKKLKRIPRTIMNKVGG